MKTSHSHSKHSIFTENHSVKSRIISSTMLNLRASSSIELLLLFTQQFQLFSQLLLHSQSLQPTLDLSSDLFTEPIYFLARILSPGWFLDFNSRASLSTLTSCRKVPLALKGLIAIITAIFCIIKGFLFAYILAFGAQKVPRNRFIFTIFNWELYLRLPLTSFFILSISSRMILLCSQNQISSISESANILYMIFFAFVILMQCWKVFGQLLFLTNLLPNSSLLASNNQHSDIITTIHQISLLVLQFIPESNPPRQTLWILTCISLPFCIISLGLHLTRFTYHYVQSLYFKGYFLSLVVLFNVIMLCRAIVLSYFTKHTFGVDTHLIIFGLLTPVVIKLVKSFLNSAVLRLMGADYKKEKMSETQLIYKLSLVYNLFRTHKPLGNNYLPTDWAYLLFNSVLSKSDLIFNIQEANDLVATGMNTEILLNQISALYLEKLSERFPKSDLIKLYIAYYHGKKLQNYETAIKILAKLEGTPVHNIRTSAILLGRDIERMIRNQTSSTDTRQIDLKSYLKSRIAILKLREEIIKQVNIQLNLYQESEKQDPDLFLVSQISQKAGKQRSSVLKLVGNTLPGLPECYLEPYFLLEGYYGRVNNSMLEQMKCKGIIEKKSQRYQKAWASSQINMENLYNPGNVLLIISGQKETMGQIHYSSSSALKTLGWDSKMLKGRNISSLVPGGFQEFYNGIMRKFNEESTKIPTDQICRAFVLHKGGFSMPVDVCIAIHPFMHQGFFLDVVIRPVIENNKEYIVVLPDGKLDSVTEKIGRKLGLTKHTVGINELSNDLEEVNKAYEYLMNIKLRRETTFPESKILEEKASIPSELLSKRSSVMSLTTMRDRTMKGLVRQLQTLKLTMGPGHMDLNKATDLVEKYATEGENVRFLPIGRGCNGEDGYLYHCKIEEKDFLETKLRIYTLQEIKKEIGESESSEIIIKGMTPKRSGTLGGLSRKRQKTTLVVLESEDSDGSEIGEEKQPGDIDITKEYFEKDISTSRALSPFKVKPLTKKGRGLRFDLGEPLSTERVFIQKSPTSNSELNTATSPQVGADSKGKAKKFNFIQKQVMIIKAPEVVLIQAEQSVGSVKSERANSKKLLAIYEQAIQAKFYPKYIQTVFILLALLYMVIFALQVNSGVIINTVLGRAERRKEVIQAADLRNLLLVNVNDIIRYELQSLTMTSDIDYFGTDTMEKLIEKTERLQDVNGELLSAASYLQTDMDRQRLFQKDVRVYDTYFYDPNPSFVSLTSLQAVNRIVSAVDSARYAIAVNDTSTAVTSLQFVLRNSLNDLLLASEKVLDIFVNSLGVFRKDNDVFLEARFLISLVLLIGSFWIAALAIWIQYKREKTNILAFSRLAPEEIGLMIGKVQEYKKSVEEETYWEKKEDDSESSEDSPGNLRGTAKKFRREGKYHGVTKEYLAYTLKLIFLLMVLIGFYTMTFVLLKNAISPVYRKANQLHYSDWMLGRISLCYTSLIELVAEENMVFIRNQPAYDQAKESLAEVQQIIRNVTTGFFEDQDGNYDENISGFLFEDICSHVPDKDLQQACFDIQSGGEVLTLVNLISVIEYSTKQILQKYSQIVDKTIGPLFSLNVKVADTLYKPLLIAQATNSLLSHRINKLFVKNLDEAKWKNISMCIWVTCLLAVMIVLFWIFIFRGIRESDNKFKNVLSMFPPGYILSNFILKNYLKKTSSEAFTLIKDEL